jgi:hypothetical protein
MKEQGTSEALAAPKLRAQGPIRVTVPAKVAYSPDAFKKSIGSLMERLGCPKCFSGADCFFQNERDFVLDAAGSVSADLNPQPLPPSPFEARRHTTVAASSGVRYDINKVLKAIDKVIDIIGPHPCISGADILFADVINTLVINEKIEVINVGAERF